MGESHARSSSEPKHVQCTLNENTARLATQAVLGGRIRVSPRVQQD